MINWSSVLLYNGSSFTDYTFILSTESDSSVTIMADADDFLYFGLDRAFDGIFCEIADNGAGSYGNVELQYYNGTTWVRMPVQRPYDFSESGVLRFPIPENWVKNEVNGITDYWVRISVGSVNDNGAADLIQSFPFPSYAYTTPEEVRALMGLRFDFAGEDVGNIGDEDDYGDIITHPNRKDVERVIRRVEGRIEGYTNRTWKPKYRENEEYNFNRFGFTAKRYPIIKLFSLELRESQSWNQLSRGRSEEYHVDERTGIVTFTRYVHLPLAHRRVRAYGWGEQRRPVRMSYIWGEDIDFDDSAYMVKDVATKLVACDLYSAYDFSVMLTQGGDRFAIDARVEGWRTDADERLEELRRYMYVIP